MGINLNSNGVFVSGILIADTVQAPNGSTDALQNLTIINGSTIDAALEIKSTEGGFQPPRMTTLEKNNLLPDMGMIVVDKTLGQLNSYLGGAWVDIGSSGGSAPANATYIVQTPNALLPNAQSLSSLGNGVMLNNAGVISTELVLDPSLGGTGVNNGTHFLQLGGNLITSGAFNSIFVMTGPTNVTFPTTGTLLTTTGITINGTANQIAVGGTSPTFTLSFPSVLNTNSGTVLDDGSGNALFIGSGGLTLPAGTVGQRLGGAGTIRLNTTSHVFEGTTDGVTWATIETSITGVTSVAGTTNQITASPTTGNVIISFPSVLHTVNGNVLDDGAGNSTFGTVTASNLSASQPVLSNGSKELISGTINLSSSSFVSGILPGSFGGTGVNNGTSTITVGGNVTYSGPFTFSGTLIGNTSVTFPTSGTLMTTAAANAANLVQYTYFGGV